MCIIVLCDGVVVSSYKLVVRVCRESRYSGGGVRKEVLGLGYYYSVIVEIVGRLVERVCK